MDVFENVVSPQLQNLANGEILIKQDLVVPDFPTNGDMSILVMWDLIRYHYYWYRQYKSTGCDHL